MDYQKVLEDLERYLEENPDYDFPIEQYKLALKLKEKISKLPGNGLKLDLQKFIDDHSEEVEQEKNPFISFLSPKDFSLDELKNTQIEFLKEYIDESEGSPEEEGLDEINRYMEAIENEPGTFDELLSLTLSNRPEVFKDLKIADEVDPALLYGLTTTLVQPAIEEMGSLVSKEVKEGWWRRTCPVCDRETTIAKLIEKKRFFHCNYCHTEYHVDFIICNHCDNTERNNFAFYRVDEDYAFEINFCRKCSHYFKTINNDLLEKPIPPTLEDILTLRLDFIAQNEGLKRVG